MDLNNLLEKELVRWNDIISSHPNDSKAYVHRGMVHFKLANVDRSIADFDIAEKLEERLTPHLWQRGLSYYYASRFEGSTLKKGISSGLRRAQFWDCPTHNVKCASINPSC